MNPTIVEALGFMAATLTTAAFIPQVVYCWRTRDTQSISLAMYASFCVGVSLWLLYGLLIKAWPVVAANFITLILAGSILWLKVHESQKQS